MIQAIVITFDHLPVSLLGCYGAEWIDTPGFNRLSAASVTCDQVFTDCADWLCEPVEGAPALGRTGWRLAELLSPRSNARLHVVGTASRLASFPEGAPAALHPAADEQSLDANVAVLREGERIAAELQRDAAPSWLWIAADGLATDGLPPLDVYDLYLDELVEGEELALWIHRVLHPDAAEDAPLGTIHADDWRALWQRLAETRHLAPATPPPTRLDSRIKRAFAAATVCVIDRELAHGLTAMDGWSPQARPPLLVCGLAGARLAFRGGDLAKVPPLLDETLQVPAWIQVPDSPWNGTRDAGLRMVTDLLDALTRNRDSQPTMSGITTPERSAILASSIDDGGAELRSVRTTNWRMIARSPKVSDPNAPADVADAQSWLFAKPEDMGDVDDQSTRRPEIVVALSDMLSGQGGAGAPSGRE
jgi:hypothetical protein